MFTIIIQVFNLNEHFVETHFRYGRKSIPHLHILGGFLQSKVVITNSFGI